MQSGLCVCVYVSVTLALVCCYSKEESWLKVKIHMYVCHIQRMCPGIFGQGHRGTLTKCGQFSQLLGCV